MKRVIRANTYDVIFENDNFVFRKDGGVGMNDTPWSGLRVDSRGLADKHVVHIRLNTTGRPNFNGEPVTYRYSDATVSHGMRTAADTLEDTVEYISVLEDAVDFAKRINEWLDSNNQGA